MAQAGDFLRLLGAPDFGGVTIFVAETLEGVGQAYSKWLHISPQAAMQQKASINGEAGFGFVFLRSPVLRVGVYHEIFHVLQASLVGEPLCGSTACLSAASVGGPVWLIEGSAVYFQDKAADYYGLFTFAGARNAHLQRARATSASLSSMETRPGIDAVGRTTGYMLGFAAVDFLLSSGPLDPLIEFWRRIGAGISWTEAFSQVFGRTSETFYQQFEAYRASVFALQ